MLLLLIEKIMIKKMVFQNVMFNSPISFLMECLKTPFYCIFVKENSIPYKHKPIYLLKFNSNDMLRFGVSGRLWD